MHSKCEKKLYKDVIFLMEAFSYYCSSYSHQEELQDRYVPYWGVQAKVRLCKSCFKLFANAVVRKANCQQKPSPSCRNCTQVCFKSEYYSKMNDVMRSYGFHLARQKIKTSLFKLFWRQQSVQ